MPKRVSDLELPGVPLKPETFDILLIVLENPMHRYAIVQAMRERADARPRDRGNTYRALRRMEADGLIEQCPPRTVKRRGGKPLPVFSVTTIGRRAAGAEARRLEKLLWVARRKRLLITE